MIKRVQQILSPGLVAFMLGFTPAGWAGPGHDHGDAPATQGGAASPRFAAVSETFELVGIVQGKQITLYLDHSADNSPVHNARLELELGGQKIPVQSHGVGEFLATLDRELPGGQHPVLATVVAAGATDLLASELDLHEDEHAATPTPLSVWLLYAGLALAFGVLAIWGLRRQFGRRHSLSGGAA